MYNRRRPKNGSLIHNCESLCIFSFLSHKSRKLTITNSTPKTEPWPCWLLIAFGTRVRCTLNITNIRFVSHTDDSFASRFARPSPHTTFFQVCTSFRDRTGAKVCYVALVLGQPMCKNVHIRINSGEWPSPNRIVCPKVAGSPGSNCGDAFGMAEDKLISTDLRE